MPRPPTSSSSSPSSTSSCSTRFLTARAGLVVDDRAAVDDRCSIDDGAGQYHDTEHAAERRDRSDRDDADGRRSRSVLPDDQRRAGFRHGVRRGGADQADVSAGRSDLAFAPYLVRALTPYLEAAPIELYERADPPPALRTGGAGLNQLGLDDRDVAALATQAADSLSRSPPTDGATVQARALLGPIAETASQPGEDRCGRGTAVAGAG